MSNREANSSNKEKMLTQSSIHVIINKRKLSFLLRFDGTINFYNL